MRSRAVRLALGLACAAALLGCGASTEAPAVGDEFAANALAVCAAAMVSKDAWQPFPLTAFDPADPDPAAFDEVALWLGDVVAPTMEDWRDGLAALGEPPTGQDAWQDVLSAVGEIAAGNEAQIAAATSGDTAAFVAATRALRAAQPVLESATQAAGVPACAEVHAD